MEVVTILVFLIIILVIALIGLIFFLFTRSADPKEDKVLQNSLTHLSQMMRDMEQKVLSGEREMKRSVEVQFQESQKLISEISEKMRSSDVETRKAFGEQFQNANKLIQEITREITEVKQGNKQVLNMTEQLSNLEKVLTNQKQRGNWGESSLELILSNFLTGHYQMQYMFKNGEMVDAVIKIKDKYLPIDSKFSLDNYQRCIDSENEDDKKFYGEEFKKDLKKRIQETAKYIDEREDTLPIAFMYIPSEAIYYDLQAGEQSRLKINTQALLEFAQKNRVYIVSPTSILAYIHLLIAGLKSFKVEEGFKEIQKNLVNLNRHVQGLHDSYEKLGNSLSTVTNHYNKGFKEIKNLHSDIFKITDGQAGGKVEILELDKPILSE